MHNIYFFLYFTISGSHNFERNGRVEKFEGEIPADIGPMGFSPNFSQMEKEGLVTLCDLLGKGEASVKTYESRWSVFMGGLNVNVILHYN